MRGRLTIWIDNFVAVHWLKTIELPQWLTWVPREARLLKVFTKSYHLVRIHKVKTYKCYKRDMWRLHIVAPCWPLMFRPIAKFRLSNVFKEVQFAALVTKIAIGWPVNKGREVEETFIIQLILVIGMIIIVLTLVPMKDRLWTIGSKRRSCSANRLFWISLRVKSLNHN